MVAKQRWLRPGISTIKNGYKVVPIAPGKKHPGFDKWEKVQNITPAQLTTWFGKPGNHQCGVGVLASSTPALDIDVYDKQVVQEVTEHVISTLMAIPENSDCAILERTGQPPKLLIPCRHPDGQQPFTKLTSRGFIDDDSSDSPDDNSHHGPVHKLEILGVGQQWVAHHIHPDTAEPYHWRNTHSTANTSHDQLPVLPLDVAQKLIRWFEDQAVSSWGWVPKSGTSATLTPASDNGAEPGDIFAAMKPPHGITAQQMSAVLETFDPDTNMSVWTKLGMACWHESQGQTWGFEAWSQWSEQGTKYNAKEMTNRWQSFSVPNTTRSHVTWGTALHMAGLTKDSAQAVTTTEQLKQEQDDGYNRVAQQDDNGLDNDGRTLVGVGASVPTTTDRSHGVDSRSDTRGGAARSASDSPHTQPRELEEQDGNGNVLQGFRNNTGRVDDGCDDPRTEDNATNNSSRDSAVDRTNHSNLSTTQSRELEGQDDETSHTKLLGLTGEDGVSHTVDTRRSSDTSDSDTDSAGLSGFTNKINNSTSPAELTGTVCADIQAQAYAGQLDAGQLAQLEHAIGVQFKALTNGARLPVSDIRDLIRPERHLSTVLSSGDVDTVSLYPWCRRWVYVTNGDYYYLTGDGTSTTGGRRLSEKGFNASYNRELIGQFDTDDDASGRLLTQASDIAKHVVKIPLVDDVIYLPGAAPLFNIDGNHLANSYRPGEVMMNKGGDGWTEPWEWSGADNAAIAIVLQHFDAIIPTVRDRDIVLNFLAHRLSYPGIKHRWALLIQGMQGDGKTFINRMMANVLGVHNVRTINASEMEEKYNKWAAGNQFVFVEELKIHGHNRWDVANRLKPLISNSAISVREMQKDSVQAPNVTDYVTFSNYTDGAPLEEGDRRWFVTFSSLQREEDLFSYVGRMGHAQGDVNSYFDELFDAIDHHAAAIGGWLRYVVGKTAHVSPEYSAGGRAPQSTAKDTMIRDEATDEEEIILSLIQDKDFPEITSDAINVTRLSQVLELEHESFVDGRVLAKLLRKLGFNKFRKFRVRNSPTRVTIYIRRALLGNPVSVDEDGVATVTIEQTETTED